MHVQIHHCNMAFVPSLTFMHGHTDTSGNPNLLYYDEPNQIVYILHPYQQKTPRRENFDKLLSNGNVTQSMGVKGNSVTRRNVQMKGQKFCKM